MSATGADQTEHPQDQAHVDNCLPCAIARAKRHLGVETAQAGVIAPLLPEHLRQPFWRETLEIVAAQLGIDDESWNARPEGKR